MTDKNVFPVITQKRQERFEAQAKPQDGEKIPCICGVFGRACRVMGQREGANRALCYGCPLAKFAGGERR